MTDNKTREAIEKAYPMADKKFLNGAEAGFKLGIDFERKRLEVMAGENPSSEYIALLSMAILSDPDSIESLLMVFNERNSIPYEAKIAELEGKYAKKLETNNKKAWKITEQTQIELDEALAKVKAMKDALESIKWITGYAKNWSSDGDLIFGTYQSQEDHATVNRVLVEKALI